MLEPNRLDYLRFNFTNLRRRPGKPPRFVGVDVNQRLIRPLAEIVRFLKPAEGGNLQGTPPLLAGGTPQLETLKIYLNIKSFGITKAWQELNLTQCN